MDALNSSSEIISPVLADARATYSPEDNKLRLYPVARLAPDLYARVRSAGFIWAPKQELFVAPMWTPGRADLLIELCGEISDEDTSLVARAEDRADRFADYQVARTIEAKAARASVSAIADNIPLGQPILIGHHSERRARKDAERIEAGMRRAVQLWETADYWKARAAGAIQAAKYKELPAVRARRIKTIEADRRKMERDKAEHVAALKFWRGECIFTNRTSGEKRVCEITEENREWIAHILGSSANLGHLQLPRKDGDRPDWDQRCGAWEGLVNHYPNLYARRTVAECQAAAMQAYPAAIARADRWLAHYDNRLAYERAMLAEGGGLATDRTGPEVGGAVRCLWAPRGGWAYIQKVNRVSVTILHQYNPGGRIFRHNEPLDKIHEVMPRAKVEELRAAGLIAEVEGKTGFVVLGVPAPEPVKQTSEPEEGAQQVQQMREILRAGVQVVSAPQLFPTPRPIAERMVALAEIQTGHRLLEPSAGTGVLLDTVRAAGRAAVTTAVEINYDLAARLRSRFDDVHQADFLMCNGDLGTFDRILMNPPFENGADIRHIQHALQMLRPGGRLVALCASGPRQVRELQPLAESWEQLPAGSFADQGTNVAVVLATFTR